MSRRLTLAPTPEQVWAGRVAGLELPGSLADQPIRWGPWGPQLRILGDHGFDQSCEGCGADVADQAQATGRAVAPWGRPGALMVRYGADGCLACRLVVVAELFRGDRFRAELDPTEVWRSQGQLTLGWS
ncbi:hypothetical protein [Parafrankia sp. EUN1f]|uniref:hypothetical protein n=1 Tax=Parafrankia sp. EUN1f TaxID=102897 RepID=UPI0001C47473|nr:hypothetical protein [Parafrankia sp. EUN1f]EFC80069.1 hypothetical protein FrEUN1fDRAFT_6796 [Parafrankia sp. EUN1f]